MSVYDYDPPYCPHRSSHSFLIHLSFIYFVFSHHFIHLSETHFQVDIVADCFTGLSLVQRHKMVYTLLAQEMAGGVHALSIRAKTAAEMESQ